MKRFKLTTMIVAAGVFAMAAYAGDKGDAALTETKTFTMDGTGTHTITNDLGTTGSGEWWTSIEVSHTNVLTNATFTVTRTRDAGYGFVMWQSDAYTNDSAAVEFLAPRLIKSTDTVTFTVANPVAAEGTKVYVTRRRN